MLDSRKRLIHNFVTTIRAELSVEVVVGGRRESNSCRSDMRLTLIDIGDRKNALFDSGLTRYRNFSDRSTIGE